jgi:hypothetical protein
MRYNDKSKFLFGRNTFEISSNEKKYKYIIVAKENSILLDFL